jgi:hypothetical protein
MHLRLYPYKHRIATLFLLAMCTVAFAKQTPQDVVFALDKGIDLHALKRNIGAVFDQIEKAGHNVRIAVIGFDTVVTDIASLSQVSEGTSRALLDGLTLEEDISSSSNVSAGIERAIAELTFEPQSTRPKTIIVFSEGAIQTGNPQTDKEYRGWLDDVLTQSAVRAKIRVLWVSTKNTGAESAIQQHIIQATNGHWYSVAEAMEGSLVNDVFKDLAPTSEDIEPPVTPLNENVLVDNEHVPLGSVSKPESELQEQLPTGETRTQIPVSTDQLDVLPSESAEVVGQSQVEPVATKFSTEKITQILTASYFTIKEWATRTVNIVRQIILEAQEDSRILVATGLLGLLLFIIVVILGKRMGRRGKTKKIDPIISRRDHHSVTLSGSVASEQASHSSESSSGSTEELFINAVMERAAHAKEQSPSTKVYVAHNANNAVSSHDQCKGGISMPQSLETGVKLRDKSISSDVTAVRPARK